MKERPILFSGPMVRAILEGRKTQTRRIGKIQCAEWTDLRVEGSLHATKGWQALATYASYPGLGTARTGICTCPYGVPGDRLWVREAFYVDTIPEAFGGPLTQETRARFPLDFYYRADGTCCEQIPECACAEVGKPRWRPSIHMPRWASRITLEVTGVRVERLRDISEADAVAEGIDSFQRGDGARVYRDYSQRTEHFGLSAVGSYRTLWESINGAGSWDAKPWVWVVEFKRVDAGEGVDA